MRLPIKIEFNIVNLQQSSSDILAPTMRRFSILCFQNGIIPVLTPRDRYQRRTATTCLQIIRCVQSRDINDYNSMINPKIYQIINVTILFIAILAIVNYVNNVENQCFDAIAPTRRCRDI